MIWVFPLTAMEGNLETIMAGLNCGTPSEIGWEILKKSADTFLSCDDQITVIGMKKLYFPSGISFLENWFIIFSNWCYFIGAVITTNDNVFLGCDERIISGESGAVCIGALSEICKNTNYEKMKKELALDENSRVLIISTEGDTDKDGFDRIVGRG